MSAWITLVGFFFFSKSDILLMLEGATREILGAVLSFVFYNLSRHPAAQARLRNELRSIEEPFWHQQSKEAFTSDVTLPKPAKLEKLPFLGAVLQESIRLRHTVPQPNPRVTPSGTKTSLGPYRDIPPGVRITTFSYCLHRNESVFPDPERWLPDRWLDSTEAELAEMRKWFWGFGSGSRRCLGSNLAMELMRYAVAAVYTNFETSVVDDSAFNYKTFITGSLKEKLLLRFVHVA